MKRRSQPPLHKNRPARTKGTTPDPTCKHENTAPTIEERMVQGNKVTFKKIVCVDCNKVISITSGGFPIK